jgi:hypothetical protein
VVRSRDSIVVLDDGEGDAMIAGSDVHVVEN